MITFSDVRERGGEISASVHVGGERFDLWFRADGARLAAAPEALVTLALPVAMARGLPIDVPGPVTPSFLRGLEQWQAVFATWYPDRLAPVEIRARCRRPGRPHRRSASMFSAGLDSFHCVLRHLDHLDALVFVLGFDVPREELPDLRETVTARVRAAAAELGKPLVEVETNLHDFSDHFQSPWGTTYHGAALAAIAQLLSPSFGELLVAGTHSYGDLFPWGSHPLTDPLLASDRVRLLHDGGADRVQKAQVVAQSEVAMRHLRVCWQNRDGDYNCGHCPKCLRTRVALRIAGALDRCETMSALTDLDEVQTMAIDDRNSIAAVAALVRHLRRSGTDPELLAACEDGLRHQDPLAVRWGERDWTSVLALLFAEPSA